MVKVKNHCCFCRVCVLSDMKLVGVLFDQHSCQYRMAAHGGEPKIRHKIMADGMAGHGKLYIYIQNIYKRIAKCNK